MNLSPAAQTQVIPPQLLSEIVSGFAPEKIGLAGAWNELYFACQAAAARPELLAAIHEIKENIEDKTASSKEAIKGLNSAAIRTAAKKLDGDVGASLESAAKGVDKLRESFKR